MTKKDKVDTGGKRLNLFPKEKKKEKPYTVDNKVFDMMETVADKTNVDITNINKDKTVGKDTKSIHNALMAAGMTPAYGNVADLADATLYVLEGELGKAAWSAAAAIPIIGQMVSSKRALKAAKEAGEEMVTLYRGIGDWVPKRYLDKVSGEIRGTGESMVVGGKFVGKDFLTKWERHNILSKKVAESVGGGGYGIFAKRTPDVMGYTRMAKGVKYSGLTGKKINPSVLEFEVPKRWWDSQRRKGLAVEYLEKNEYWIEAGIPKEFLKKVHKASEYKQP